MNLNACLDSIFELNQITILKLSWDGLSLEKVKSALRNQRGKKKGLKCLSMNGFAEDLDDNGLLEICAFLPDLEEWVGGSRSTITIEGVNEWWQICPHLVHVSIDGCSDEVIRELRRLCART
jgi:hypothetical protein